MPTSASGSEFTDGARHGRASAGVSDRTHRQHRALLGSSLREILGSRAGPLLIGISVYREGADRNALLFQAGVHDWTAARAGDARGPAPPYQPPADLAELITACADAGLLTRSDAHHDARTADDVGAVFVDRWIASEMRQWLLAADRRGELAEANRRAAAYWRWRAAAWSQGPHADLRDLLEARYHLLEAGDIDQASDLTEAICAQLRAWGELDHEAALIQATLDAMPSPSAGHAGWLHELGAIAQVRDDHHRAESLYLRAVEMFTQVGDASGVSRSYESLGVLAHARGDYQQAERHYRDSATYRASRSAWAQDAPAAIPEEPVPAAPALADPARADPARHGPGGPAAPESRQPASPSGRGSAASRHARAPRRNRRSRRSHRVVHLQWLGRPEVLAAPLLGLVTLAATTIAVARVADRPAPDGPGPVGPGSAARARGQAAGWVAGQVSRSAVVACDPAMYAALRAYGIPAGDLLLLGHGAGSDPLGSDVIVATAALRSEFGARLAGVYAPLVLARFGVGSSRIEVRVTAPDGAAAYLRALGSDQLARRTAGTQLLHNGELSVTPVARDALTSGRVDSRLLMTIAALAAMRRLRVIGFGDSGPSAGPGAPLRSAEVAAAGSGSSVGALPALRGFLRAQRAPYLAYSVSVGRLPTGQPALRVEFGVPSPLGLLTADLAPETGSHP